MKMKPRFVSLIETLDNGLRCQSGSKGNESSQVMGMSLSHKVTISDQRRQARQRSLVFLSSKPSVGAASYKFG